MKNFTEAELKEYAEQVAKTIVIRTYVNGNSDDSKRETTLPEREIIKSIIFGGLLSINRGLDSQRIIDACEFIADLQIPEMNGYDTIYNPMQDFVRINKEQTERT